MKKILLVLFIILFSSFVSAETPPVSGLTYWNLSGLTDLWDGFDLTNSGADNNDTFPLFNLSGDSSPSSFFFDSGNDRVTNPTFLDTNIPDDFTISMWISHLDTFDSGKASSEYFLSKENIDAQDRINCFFDSITGKIKCFTEANNDISVFIETSQTSWEAGVWYHIVYVAWGSGGNKLYVNATLEDTDSSTTTKIRDGTFKDFILGNHQDLSGTIDCNGCNIDVVKTFNKSLNISEIENLYNCNNITTCDVVEINLSIDNQTYNMTSDGGCIVWRNDTTENCNTTDGTFSMNFETNRAADCSIRATQSSGDSFPSFNSNFSCSTTGGTTHICTVFFSDRLSFGQNYGYASCTDGGNATTGALAINMTAGEGGGTGLKSCIKSVSSGCAFTLTADPDCFALVKI